MNETPSTAPEALMLLGTHCPHCPQVLQALSELVKQGEIGKLEVINLEQHPETAAELGVRSVPWVRLGRFELTGLRSLQELREWAQKANSTEGMVLQLNELLTSGQIDEAVALVKKEPDYLDAIMEILAEPDAKINVRVGIGVIMEELQGTKELQQYIEQLGKLTQHKAAPVRADAAHYLALTESPAARSWLEALLKDENAEVREIAGDGLLLLDENDG